MVEEETAPINRNLIPGREKYFLFSKDPKQILGSIQSPITAGKMARV
jgi:hypothetical protein